MMPLTGLCEGAVMDTIDTVLLSLYGATTEVAADEFPAFALSLVQGLRGCGPADDAGVLGRMCSRRLPSIRRFIVPLRLRQWLRLLRRFAASTARCSLRRLLLLRCWRWSGLGSRMGCCPRNYLLCCVRVLACNLAESGLSWMPGSLVNWSCWRDGCSRP